MLGAPVVLALLESADANPEDNFAALKGACCACTLRCAASADVLALAAVRRSRSHSHPPLSAWADGVAWRVAVDLCTAGRSANCVAHRARCGTAAHAAIRARARTAVDRPWPVLTLRRAGVREYIIDPEKTAFRWWSKPFAPAAIQQASLEQSGDMCVTKFAFTSSSIAGAALNTTGWNRLIWAVNKATAYPGYHTEGLRGHITIDFSSGAILPQPTQPPSAPAPTAAPTGGVFSDSKTTSGTVGAPPHECWLLRWCLRYAIGLAAMCTLTESFPTKRE